MTRAIAIYGAAITICIATSSSAQHIEPGHIISLGQNLYKIRLVNETGPLNVEVADRNAMKLAAGFCVGMKKSMVVKGKTFDMGYGYTLTWECLQPKYGSVDQ